MKRLIADREYNKIIKYNKINIIVFKGLFVPMFMWELNLEWHVAC